MISRAVLLVLLGWAFGLGQVAFGQIGDRADNLLIFVGEKISVEEIDLEEYFKEEDAAAAKTGTRIVVRSGVGVRARYRVLDVLRGDYAGAEIKFEAWDHFGRFSFSEQDHVLLYVWKTETGYVHAKYLYDAVYPLRSGGYAGCGNPYLDYGFEDRERLNAVPLKAYDYTDPPETLLSEILLPDEPVLEAGEEPYSEEDLEDYRYAVRSVREEALLAYAPPVYEMTSSSTLECRMGVSLNALVDAQWRARFLPGWIRDDCEETLGLNSWEERKENAQQLAACITNTDYVDWR